MAYITLPTRPALADRFRKAIATFRANRARRAVYLTTLRELQSLSNRDLDDLGISRHNIDEIAWAHAYGA